MVIPSVPVTWWPNSSVYSHIVWTELCALGFLLKHDFMYVCLWLCICTCMPSWCCSMESNWLSDSHSVKLDFEQPTCNNYASFFFFWDWKPACGQWDVFSWDNSGESCCRAKTITEVNVTLFALKNSCEDRHKKSILSMKTHWKKIPEAYAIRWAGKNFVTVGLVILCQDTFFREYNGNQWPCRTPFCKFHVYWISMEFLFITQQRCWRPVRAMLKA